MTGSSVVLNGFVGGSLANEKDGDGDEGRSRRTAESTAALRDGTGDPGRLDSSVSFLVRGICCFRSVCVCARLWLLWAFWF